MKRIFTLMLFLFLSCKNEPCKNGTINSPKCDQCPQGRIFMEGQCALLVAPPQEQEHIDDELYPKH